MNQRDVYTILKWINRLLALQRGGPKGLGKNLVRGRAHKELARFMRKNGL